MIKNKWQKIIKKAFTNHIYKEVVFKICEEHPEIRIGPTIQKKYVQKLITDNYQKR